MPVDAAGGIEPSSMEFLNYRVVELKLASGLEPSTTPGGIPDDAEWRIGIGLGDVAHYQDDDIYVSYLSAKMALLPSSINKVQTRRYEEDALSAEGTIYGVFRFAANAEIDPALKQNLLLNQTPALLMPFLRAAISGLLALAGYGAVPMPLINMARIAETTPRSIVEVKNTGRY